MLLKFSIREIIMMIKNSTVQLSIKIFSKKHCSPSCTYHSWNSFLERYGCDLMGSKAFHVLTIDSKNGQYKRTKVCIDKEVL
jgi:hypothetical protein